MPKGLAVENNAGSGFSLDDEDEDFDALLNHAAAVSDGDEGGASDLDAIDGPPAVMTKEKDVDPVKDTKESYDSEAQKLIDELDGINDDPKDEKPVPVEVPAPPVEVPVVSSKAVKPHGGVRIRTEDELEQDTSRIIRVLDAYRDLSSEEREVALQFISNGQAEGVTDSKAVVKVINADQMLLKTMSSMCEVYELAPVDRAFYVMALDSKTLHMLGDLVSVFTQSDYNTKQSNLQFAKEVVSGIEQVGDREISYVKATESLLSASRTEG
jgi:hypothetical protein